MNKTIKEQYIKFGIDNGYKGTDGHWLIQDIDKAVGYNKTERFIFIITSKPFIESIARGMTKNWCQTEDWNIVFKDKVKWLIVHQAKAIAEFEGDTLEDYIINLGIGIEKNK